MTCSRCRAPADDARDFAAAVLFDDGHSEGPVPTAGEAVTNADTAAALPPNSATTCLTSTVSGGLSGQASGVQPSRRPGRGPARTGCGLPYRLRLNGYAHRPGRTPPPARWMAMFVHDHRFLFTDPAWSSDAERFGVANTRRRGAVKLLPAAGRVLSVPAGLSGAGVQEEFVAGAALTCR